MPNCTFKPNCRRCADEHKIEECATTEAHVKCSNCVRSNKDGTNYNTRHRASDQRCMTRRDRVDALKSTFLEKN